MPTVETALRVGNAGIFAKIDLQSAFWQIPILPEHQLRTAFTFRGKTYIWGVMPFGVRNSPATFQRLVGNIFRDIIDRYVKIYIDDILCCSNTWGDHVRQIEEVLGRLAKNGLKASMEKSE